MCVGGIQLGFIWWMGLVQVEAGLGVGIGSGGGWKRVIVERNRIQLLSNIKRKKIYQIFQIIKNNQF